MSFAILQFIILLLVQQVSASLPLESTLAPATESLYTFACADPANLLETLCHVCDIPLQFCRCLSVATTSAWSQFAPQPQQHQQQLQQLQHPPLQHQNVYQPPVSYYPNIAYTQEPILPNIPIYSHVHGLAPQHATTVRPQDILEQPEWPSANDISHALTMAGIPPSTPALTMEGIDQSSDNGSDLDSLHHWASMAYNPGDRLSPPQHSSAPTTRRRHAAKQNGFPCDHSECGEVFDRPCDLRRHRKKHVRKSERPHKCSQCDEAFIYPKDLERHFRTHEPQRQVQKFLCSVEGCKSARTGFGRKDNYLRHMRDKHSGSSVNTD